VAYYRRPWALYAFVVAAYAFLFAPIVYVVANSFNADPSLVGWGGATFKWYHTAWNDSLVRDAAVNSVEIAIAVTLVSATLGTITALGVQRSSRWGRMVLNATTYTRIVIPELVLALALLIFMTKIGFPRGKLSLIVGHSILDSAYVAVIVSARLANRDIFTDEAARDLGATPFRAFRRVVLPDIMPAIVAGSLLAFTFSLDDVVTSFFLNGSVNTLPLVILSLIRFSVTPEVNAIGVMLMTVTTTLMVCFLVINHRWARSGA
jgi:spermidine/putrescine transport system permease protein